jgi:hypothetical protein
MNECAFALLNDASRLVRGKNIRKVEKLGDDDRMVVRLWLGDVPPLVYLYPVATLGSGGTNGPVSVDVSESSDLMHYGDTGVFVDLVVAGGTNAIWFVLCSSV